MYVVELVQARVEVIMKLYIRAMPEYQKEIRRELSAKGKQVLRHLICVILYPDAPDYNHWKNEIVSFIEDVDKVKGKNKWSKPAFIKEAISTQNDMIDAVIKQVKLKEREYKPKSVSISEILKGVEKYQDWLANELSANGIIDPYEAQDLIDKIVSEVAYKNE